MATGAMLMQQTDLTLPAAGLPLLFERTHLSSYRAGVTFGPTWVSTLDECVQIDAQGVVFAAADGMRLVYPVPQPGVPVLPVKGARWPLEWDGHPDGVMTITDPTGVVRTFAGPMTPSDTRGAYRLPVESWHDRNDTRSTLDRDHQGLPTALRHSGGYHLAIENSGHLVTALRLLDAAPSAYERLDPQAAMGTVVVRYGYDEAGRLSEVINSSGKPLRFTYDDEGRITSWTDRNTTSFQYVYDERGRVVRTEGSGGVFSGSFTYDDQTRTTSYIDSLGNTSLSRCNADGWLIEETDPIGNTTRTRRDDRGRPVEVTDPQGNTSCYTYDDRGHLSTVVLPDGTTSRARYSDLGLPIEASQPGRTWRHRYDDRGNLLTTTDPLGAETCYTYDDVGHLTAVTNALGNTSHTTRNPAGLPVAVSDELGHTTTLHRDAFGRITEVTDPLGHTTRLGWTVEGKPAWREYPDGSRETWEWDGEGNLLTHIDPAGNTTLHTVGAFDAPATRTDPDGATYTFSHDTELRLTTVTNPQGQTWTYSYDAAGRLTAETDFDGRCLTYAHDASGRLISRTDAAGETLHLARDGTGRITSQWYESSPDDITTYAYNTAGDLIRATNPVAEIVIERDPLGRVLTESVGGRTLTCVYDALGRRIRRTTPSELVSEWSYDPADRPCELRSDAGTLTLAHDAAGRETDRHIGNRTTLTQTWNASDQLTVQALLHHPAHPLGPGSAADPTASRLLQHRTYAYRADGCLTEVRELTSGTRRFTLDGLGRVTSVQAHGWTETYAYDSAGNLTHATAPGHPAPGDRTFQGTLLRRAGRTSYEHDRQGRLTRRTARLLNGQKRVWVYAWGPDDRLTEVLTPEGARWQYTYDPLGRRVSKHRLAHDGSPVDRTSFHWDHTRLVEQWRAGGDVTTWEYLPGTHRPVTQTDHRALIREPGRSVLSQWTDDTTGAPTTRFHAIVTDPLGTPTKLVTSDGALAWQHHTTVWGTDLPAAPGMEPANCPLRFPGQYRDMETGLHYNYFRTYDPETARYVSADPLGLEAAPNPAAYVKNPYTWADTLGLSPESCGTVWKDIKPTQPNYPGTELPKSFEMQAGDHRVWVHGNATKHINEYVQGRIAEGVGPQQAKMATQAHLRSLQAAVEDATHGGVPLGRMVEADGWELKFSQRPEDRLPALVHALYKG